MDRLGFSDDGDNDEFVERTSNDDDREIINQSELSLLAM